MALSVKRIDDAETLKAFAHPLRMKLLGSLRRDGPATASELARRFGESSGSTSYHLRQLQRFGFVEEDADQPSKRERRWRSSHDMTSWQSTDFADDESARAADDVIRAHQLQYLLTGVEEFRRTRDEWGPAWIDAAGHSDYSLRVRPGDLRAVLDEIYALLRRRAEDPRPDDDPEAAFVSLHLLAYPAKDTPT